MHSRRSLSDRPGRRPRPSTLSLLFLLLLPFLFAPKALAQGAPEVLFRIGHLSGDCSTTPTMSLLSSSTRNDNGTWTEGVFTYTDTSSATASSGSLSMSTEMTVERPAGSTGGSQCAGYGFEVYTKHPADMTLAGSGSASGSFSGGSGGTLAFATYPINAGSYGLSQTSGQSGSTSGSGNLAVNLTCSASGTQFSEYSGVTYYRAFQSNGQLYKVNGTVTLGGTGAASGTVSGSGSVAVQYATGTPVAVISPAAPGGMVGNQITLTNASYDPDGPGGTQGTCAAEWVVQKPDGSYYTTSYSNSSYVFTPTAAGKYTANLTVTDNEGSTAATSVSFGVRSATGHFPGSDGRNSSETQISCGGPGAGGSGGGTMTSSSQSRNLSTTMSATATLNPQSGNAAVEITTANLARANPLDLRLRINAQSLLNRDTNMHNIASTYGLGMHKRTYLNGGGSQQQDRYLVDADGTEFYLGPWSNTPVSPTGFYGTFQSGGQGWYLIGAGPPGDIWQAGNWQYEFYTGGALYKITDPNNNVHQVIYTQMGSWSVPTEAKDLSTGRKLTFQYDTPPYIARIVENGGDSVFHITYDSNNRASSVQLKNSSGTLIEKVDITYTSQGLLSTITKDGDSSSTVTYSYVNQGNNVYLGNLSWSGGSTSFNYFGPPTTGAAIRTVATNSLGGQTSYDYDSSGRLIKLTLPAMNGATQGVSYTFQNDSNYNVTQVSDGATTTDFTYNSKGKVTEIDDNNGGVWTFTYASNGIDLTQVADSVGTVLGLVYGSSNAPHQPSSITDGDGNTWTKTYNSYGQVLTVVPPSGSPTGTTTYEYEETSTHANYGYLKKITNGAGNITQFSGYTGTGNVTSVVQTPETGTNITTSFAYDAGNRLTTLTHPDSKTRTYAYTYRKLTSVTDEAGNATSFTFCSVCGKLSGLLAPLSKSLSWSEDGDHRTTGFTDARSNETEYEYGLAGELKKTTYPDSSYTIYRYDNYGRLAEKEDTRGNKEQYGYDAAGRVETFTLDPASGSTIEVAYAYNDDNTVQSVTDEVGTTTFTYTPGRRVSNVAYDWNASGLSTVQNVANAYNADGTLDTTTWKNGTTTVASWEYGYDGAGRVTSIDNNFSETTSYTYDGVGKLKTQTNDNGTSLTFTWNQQRGWPTQILYKAGTTPFARYDLEYDDGDNTVGNITEVTELDSSVVDYTYDDLYRLTAETRTGTGSYTRSYGYDLAGNLTTYGGSAFASYDNTNKISSLSGGSISYDADGNTTAVSGAGIPSTTLTWDVRNKLLRQQTSTDDLSYRYDHTGKRVVRWATALPAVKTFYVFSGDTLIGEVTAGTPSYAYTWGTGGLVSQRGIVTNQSLWYHFGPQGESRQLTNAAGLVVDGYSYDGYGRPNSSSGIDFNPFKYGGRVGYYSEGLSGIMLATQRWYSPQLSRWASRDPIGYEGGENLYGYVAARPTRFLDPEGLNSIEATPHYPSVQECAEQCLKGLNEGLFCSGALGLAAGQPLLPTRGKFAGATAGTSLASRYFRNVFPTSIPQTFGAGSVGGAVGRLVPFVGAGLMSIEGGGVSYCTLSCAGYLGD